MQHDQHPNRPSYLRLLREQQNRSLSSVAKEVGLDKGSLSRIERGQRPLRVSQLVRIARALGQHIVVETLRPFVEEQP
jgi:transcriptional regulator with XRE-family HTH domain